VAAGQSTVIKPGAASFVRFHAPPLLQQIPKLARYQLREYLRSRRFFAMAGIVLAIGVILTAIVGHYRGPFVTSNVDFYAGGWGAAASYLVVLVGVLFGGDAIAGEFQNKTGYFLMGLPVRRSTVYLGKFLAAYAAAATMVLLYFGILLVNGAYYFGGGLFPWQFGISALLAFVYLGAVLGATFLFSSLFKISAYGFVLTSLLFLIGFTILQDYISAIAHTEPWMVISYASGTIGSVFDSPVNWGFTGTSVLMHGDIDTNVVVRIYTVAGVAEGVVIMVAYILVTLLAGLWLFEREDFS
jgi:ABC-2 type transport system permease protein